MSGGRLGVQIAATTPPSELLVVAAEAERLGFGEIWLAEDYFDLGGMASAAAVLGATRELPVGLGVVSVRARHPAVTAMELATLAGAFPGRFMAGLGHGVPAWVGQMGLTPTSVLRSLREAATAVRRLLDGEVLSEEGEYHAFHEVRLRFPPPARLPLYFGVHGPRSLELAGEVADGTILGWFSSPEYVRQARAHIDEGRRIAGRSDHHAVVALCILSLSAGDPRTARAELAGWSSTSLAAMVAAPEMRATGAGQALAEALAVRGPSQEPLPAAVLERFMAAGDAAACGRFIDSLLEAGADRVVLVPNPAGIRTTSAMVEQIRRAAVLLG